MSEKETKTGLELLRVKFPDNQIGKLAKGSKEQTQCKSEEKRNCSICGGWHHPKMIHLDYVGHAALTDRLLDADPMWSWEPFAIGTDGLPMFDTNGGLWIKLTVCGVTRIGYGNAVMSQFKEIGSREKETIGDALRNAAMRFGAALELWHKGDLHGPEGENEKPPATDTNPPPSEQKDKPAAKKIGEYMALMDKAKDLADLTKIFNDNLKCIIADLGEDGEKKIRNYNRMLAEAAKWIAAKGAAA